MRSLRVGALVGHGGGLNLGYRIFLRTDGRSAMAIAKCEVNAHVLNPLLDRHD